MAIIHLSRAVQKLLHAVAFLVIIVAGLAALAYTVASFLGMAPWLTFEAQIGDTVYANAGQITQIGLTALLLTLMCFLPSSGRVLALENSHRNFRISMEDVAKAYHYCHAADRQGVFTMSSEFDQVRERLGYLRDHPDLARLEPAVMEVAAQMSQQSRHLADVYSDEKVARAREFLAQRQEEAEMQQERIVEALHACTEIRRWREQVELEESVVSSQVQRLEEQLEACLPQLGFSVVPNHGDIAENVTRMPMKPAAE
ncbi:hypothetical protein OG2516_01686 [Oceanicola granulosus HTCC2516]|uniref:DNA repair protein n=1 Tax=Oceanicola granulosus (strain ATCC BAA-861 / DSM 15982 / KCTC 12143 / HTCC2516) TaxID=314256 RepID=Q2CFV2_OCEGH|nr:hypothetical protein [Oceanicola granulosus]EAR51590.1 hypothetical protein OG2516_01686 [Oceanicola granulosus HTCC2516]